MIEVDRDGLRNANPRVAYLSHDLTTDAAATTAATAETMVTAATIQNRRFSARLRALDFSMGRSVCRLRQFHDVVGRVPQGDELAPALQWDRIVERSFPAAVSHCYGPKR